MMDTAKAVQKDMIKTNRKVLWSKFIKAIKDYRLIEDGDKVAVAVSGGKDSLLLAKMMQELTKHPLADFEVVLIAMDPGYQPYHIDLIKQNAQKLGIDLNIVKKDVFKVAQKQAPNDPCFICARVRRGVLYSIAESFGCNKLALGHHFDDVIETTLLNLFYAGTFKTMLPKVEAQNFDGLSLIRPLFYIKENAIINLMKRHAIETIDCGCPLELEDKTSKRSEVKTLIKTLKQQHPGIDKSIFNATTNVNLDYVVGWEKNKTKYRFDD